MAPPSPRRSSRARATNSQPYQSSTSSAASGRAERSSRAFNRNSPGNSTPSASLSSEPFDGPDDTLLGRRRKRGQEEDAEKNSRQDPADMANISDDLQDDEDEAVRCLCGSEEYPGRPVVDGPDAELFAGLELTEDLVGFFVQCDICKVWQHGACAGIFSAESSPDEYFCEQCRKDLHKIAVDNNGQKYSKYLPLHRQSRATSRATSVVKERTQSPKNGSKNLRPPSSQASKRRSTMNSRDAAYDDEQLRRAIEASKENSSIEVPESLLRRTKRGRSDSEENAPSIKRQRTNSQSQSPSPQQGDVPKQEDSDDEEKANSEAKDAQDNRSQREKSEKEDKEPARQDSAGRRRARSDRRRGEDSDPSDEAPLAASKSSAKKSEEPTTAAPEPPAAAAATQPPAEQPSPGTPPTPHAAAGNSHKKGARSHHKKSKGKNQYTKDRDVEHDGSPARSMSRDIQKSTEEPAAGTAKGGHHDTKHTSKSKASVAHKMSMLDMKRRVGAIMDFISRTQVDLAAEGSIGTSSSTSTDGDASPRKTPSAQINAEADGSAATGDDDQAPDKEFKDLNCIEMMDVLTRDMVKWQNQYT